MSQFEKLFIVFLPYTLKASHLFLKRGVIRSILSFIIISVMICDLIVVVFGLAITGAVMGRAKGVGGLDEVVDVDLMLALSAGNKEIKVLLRK